MKYEKFKSILNREIFENNEVDLIEKIAKTPNRFLGLFRPSKIEAKILQNILQSNEIKFGNVLEKLFREYFAELGYENLERRLKNFYSSRNKFLSLDQLFTDGKNIYFVEQKIRDDHDDSKIEGQFLNLRCKVDSLVQKYDKNKLIVFNYFIDDGLKKWNEYYTNELIKLENEYGIKAYLCYGKEFWEKIDQNDTWNEILNYLKKWKNEIPLFPEINFDKHADISFEKIKNIAPSLFNKIFSNDDISSEILPILFPEKKTLKLLKKYFIELGKTKNIYKNLADKIKY